MLLNFDCCVEIVHSEQGSGSQIFIFVMLLAAINELVLIKLFVGEWTIEAVVKLTCRFSMTLSSRYVALLEGTLIFG